MKSLANSANRFVYSHVNFSIAFKRSIFFSIYSIKTYIIWAQSLNSLLQSLAGGSADTEAANMHMFSTENYLIWCVSEYFLIRQLLTRVLRQLRLLPFGWLCACDTAFKWKDTLLNNRRYHWMCAEHWMETITLATPAVSCILQTECT